MLRVVDLDDTPRVDPGADELSVDLNFFLRANNREGHHGLSETPSAGNTIRVEYATDTKLAVVLDSVFVILLDIVREVVDWNIIIFDVFHNLRGCVISWGTGKNERQVSTHPLFETA